MQTIAGGILKVEFDSDSTFPTPTEIKLVLKDGTSILPITNSEEDADGHEVPTTKEMDVNIRSADNDESVGSAYQRLLTAEENRTPLAFRFWLMNGKKLVIRNVVQHTTREFNEDGKFNAIDVYGVGVADSESTLWNIITVLVEYMIFAGSSGSSGLATNFNGFIVPFGAFTQTVEDGAKIQVVVPGTFSLLYCRISRANSGSASSNYTFTARLNGADTAVTKQIGGAQGNAVVGSDVTHSFHAVAGDLFSMHLVGAGNASGIDFAEFSILFTPD